MKKAELTTFMIMVAAGIFLLSAVVSAQDTPHDFAFVSSTGPKVERVGVCMFCHKPHRSTNIRAGWGKVTPGGSVYRDANLRSATGDETRISASSQITFVCLSCHDETIHGNEAHPVPTPATDDASRGIRMDLGESNRIRGRLPVYDGMIECATCHDPHNHASEKYLRHSESMLCSDCHEY